VAETARRAQGERIRSITDLLQRAVAEIERLPAEDQDPIAARILAEVADEEPWEARFRATSDNQWDRLAEVARREIARGDVTPLDEVFPPEGTRQ
jgi:hypothetical protein